MGNDTAYQFVGICTIRIKMFDGVIRDLTNIRYVSKIKKNIISVGAAESKGLKVTFKDGILKITKGSMVVIKGVRDRNLYYLKGSTVTGALAASMDSDDDVTKLWHMRLGHSGEKFMQDLAKQGLLKGAKTYKLEIL